MWVLLTPDTIPKYFSHKPITQHYINVTKKPPTWNRLISVQLSLFDETGGLFSFHPYQGGELDLVIHSSTYEPFTNREGTKKTARIW